MELLLILFGLWGLFVICAPFGIWNAKARITTLEERIENLSKQLIRLQKTQHDETHAYASKKTQYAEKKMAQPEEAIKKSSAPVDYKKYEAEFDFDMQEQSNSDVALPPEKAYVPEIELTSPPTESIEYVSDHAPEPAVPVYDAEPILPDWVKSWFTGGRLFVTVGIVLLFIGAAMLFKYVAHFIEVPIELRFMGVALAALGMIAFGRKVMPARWDYGLYLQGGGLGLLFLTVFSAFKFYSLLSPTIAFALLVGIGGCTIWLSVVYNSLPLAVLALVGGFLAPILTSTGQGSHIALFSYYLLLNLVIFAIAWFKSWRVLNFTGFAFTFVIGLLWGGKYYTPEFYNSVQGFLIIYFLLYVGISILFASRSKPNVFMALDAASIFGVPLIGFTLQMALTHGFEYGIAISAAGLSVFYGVLSFFMRSTTNEGWQLLRRIYAAFAILFFSLAIPYAVDARTTSSLWAVEGACLMWMYAQSRNLWYVRGGFLLIGGSAIALLFNLHSQGEGQAFFNGFYMAGILVVFSAWFGARVLNNQVLEQESEPYFVMMLMAVLGLSGWFGMNIAEITSMMLPSMVSNPLEILILPWLVFVALSSFLFFRLQKYTEIPLWEYPIHAVIFAILGAVFLQSVLTSPYHPLAGDGYWAWPLVFGVYYFGWLKTEHTSIQDKYHFLAGAMLVLLSGFELDYRLYISYADIPIATEQILSGYRLSGWLLASCAGITLTLIKPEWCAWPVLERKSIYQTLGKFLWIWSLIIATLTCLDSSTATLSGYIPNLVDLVLILSAIILTLGFLHLNKSSDTYRIFQGLLVIGLIGIFNCLLLRLTSHMLQIPYLSPEMFASATVQTTLTITWTLLSMTTMIGSSKLGIRSTWFLGAGLLGIVIIKLFVVDLAGVGTLARIISFIGVGLLTVSMGYFSPIPPKEESLRKA